jgi:hypothetical protein
MSLTKLFLEGNNPPRESLVSDIPAGDGNVAYLLYSVDSDRAIGVVTFNNGLLTHSPPPHPLDVLWYVKHWFISGPRANGSLCIKLGLNLMFFSFYKVYETQIQISSSLTPAFSRILLTEHASTCKNVNTIKRKLLYIRKSSDCLYIVYTLAI